VKRNLRLIFVISGPSGSGKTTLLKRLIQQSALKNKLFKSISVTTRPKRSGEKAGRDYFFIPEKEFKAKRKAKNYLEWTRYLGYYYATPKNFIEQWQAKDKHIVLCLDLRGTLKLKKLYPENTVTIFIRPPSLGALRQRIEKRSGKTHKAEIKARLKLAKKELLVSTRYDYCLENKELTQVVKELKKIILKKIGAD
jgi:guanylate kinase